MAAEPIRPSVAPARADVVLQNGKVFGADPAHRFAQALAVAADRILAVGATDEIAALADARTRRIDLGGRTVIPGFNDPHFHHTPDPRAIMLPVTGMEPTWDELLDTVAAAVKDAPGGTWILGTHGITVVKRAPGDALRARSGRAGASGPTQRLLRPRQRVQHARNDRLRDV